MTDFPRSSSPFEGPAAPQVPQPPVQVSVSLPNRRPVVTYALLAVTILVFVAQAAAEWLLGVDVVGFYGMKINEFIVQGQLWRLFTPMLLHGSIPHLAFNMYALYMFGRALEGPYGHGRLLVLYGVAGFAGNVLSFLLTPNPAVGASTSIFGLIAAEGVFIYRHRKMLGDRGRRALIEILLVAGINLVLGMSEGIDNWGHLGGLIGGLVFAWFAGPQLELQGFYPLTLADQRQTRHTLLAALGVGGLFGILAMLKIVFFP